MRHLEKIFLSEDEKAKREMKESDFTPLNERLSYGVGRSVIHVHLATSYEVKDKLPEMFEDAMKKLALIVSKNKKIEEVTMTSWLVATNTYGTLLQKLGFEIVEMPSDLRHRHFADETREMKMAKIDRERFLSLHLYKK